jgi:hypothetical protein
MSDVSIPHLTSVVWYCVANLPWLLCSQSTPPDGCTIQKSMTHHHHDSGHLHPARAVSVSLLRMSAAERLVVALGLAGALWLAVWWVAS